MGNSIRRSANQSAHEEPSTRNSATNPNPNRNSHRIRFSTSLSSLSSFTSKYLFRSRRSYSLSTINPISEERPAKASQQVIRRILMPSNRIKNHHLKSYTHSKYKWIYGTDWFLARKISKSARCKMVDSHYSLHIWFVVEVIIVCVRVCVLFWTSEEDEKKATQHNTTQHNVVDIENYVFVMWDRQLTSGWSETNGCATENACSHLFSTH